MVTAYAVCDSAACTLNCFVRRRHTLAFNLEQGQMLDWKMFWYLVLRLACREWIEEVALLEGQFITQRLKGCGEKVFTLDCVHFLEHRGY